MNNTPSPLEYLASFAITFAAGMAASAALSAYAKWAREKAVASCSSNK
ncbi:hypothetical protein [Malikia spinosa]|nr:hypothetical protein [Malikia spinosa]